MASKMVVDRQRREQRLQRVLQDLRGETVQGLVERLSPFVKEEDDLESSVVCLMDAVDGLLATETQDLVEADERNVRTGIRVDGLRRERDEAARELRGALVEIREMVTQHTKGVRIELRDDELSAIANLQEALLIVGRKPELARSVWKRQRPVGRPARHKKRKRKATQRTGKGNPKKTTTRKAGSKMSSKEVASS